MSKKSISIHDVAALAKVSVGSASRVINGAANVTPDVRSAVERAIAALKYRPSHAAQVLRSRSSKTIGCLFSDVTNPLYARAFRTLEERFRPDGYMLLLANGLNDAAREVDILSTFQTRGMDGVIIAPGNERNAEVLAAVRGLSMPAVIYDRDMAVDADAVLFDHAAAIRLVCAELFRLGHTRIGMALWQTKSRPVRRRIEGYRSAYKTAGLPVPDLLVLEATSTSSAYDDMMALMARPDAPTALIAQGTYTLMSAVRAILDRGKRIPEDISVIGIGDTDFAQTFRPPLNVLRTPVDLVADKAREFLLGRIQARDEAVAMAARKELLPYEYVRRGSVGPVRRG